MLTSLQIEKAAARLLAVRASLRTSPAGGLRSPLPSSSQLLPSPLAPQDESTAYAIQDTMIRALGPVAGWKVAGSRPHGPSCAPVFQDILHVGGDPLPWTIDPATEFECEIGFELGRDLPDQGRPYPSEEVAAAIRATRVTVELLAPRFQGSASQSDRWLGIAEGQACGALIVGGQADNGFMDVDRPRQPVRIEADGVVLHKGVGGNALPRLLPLLVWLANHLRGRDWSLKEGQFITTGSCTGKHPWGDASRIVVNFEGVGELTVTHSLRLPGTND